MLISMLGGGATEYDWGLDEQPARNCLHSFAPYANGKTDVIATWPDPSRAPQEE
jgi:hypothetical protein